MTEAQYSLDIAAETCPLTFMKAKLLLDNMAAGEVACIRPSAGEALDNLPCSLRDQGHSVLELRAEARQPNNLSPVGAQKAGPVLTGR